jgi:hypothetical protein
MSARRTTRIRKLKDKAVDKLDEMLDSGNDSIVLKSVAAILDLPEEGEGDGAIGALAALLTGPAGKREGDPVE